MAQYRLRVTRGPMSRTELIANAQDAFDRATELLQESYDTLEVRTPEGDVLFEDNLQVLIGKRRRNSRRRPKAPGNS